MKKNIKTQNRIPAELWFFIGVSFMFIVFRYLFLAEFGLEMDILSTLVPGFTAGAVTAWKLKK